VIEGRGEAFRVAELGQNALVGEMGILSESPRSATVAALENTVALRIDKRVFLELLTQFPQMAIGVMRELAGRLERTNAQLAAQAGS
jgi:CRP-like cAMP-binding protein